MTTTTESALHVMKNGDDKSSTTITVVTSALYSKSRHHTDNDGVREVSIHVTADYYDNSQTMTTTVR